VEDVDATAQMALRLRDLCADLGIPFVFKASYDKANRTAITSARGPGWERGLEILAQVKARAGVPLLSDVHETAQVPTAAQVCDVLQIPAFLCRQTDLLVAAGESGRPVNIKKGQFMAPADMIHSVRKVTSTGNERVTVTERGFSFGYNNLVVDMRAIPILRGFGVPVVFDGTHSVQLPSGAGGRSGGQREFVAPLVYAAVAAGADALFLETHPDPDSAPCDGPNMVPMDDLPQLLRTALRIFEAVRSSLS
jgi:2-dehydro-3-deoxyphosphooctonate aldolase (KDO 8-P synthase)